MSSAPFTAVSSELKRWKVANVEFSKGEWTFLVVRGEREAELRIEARLRGVTTIIIELSEPLPEEEPAPKETPHKREAGPAAKEPGPPGSLARPDDYEEGGDDLGDAGGDDGGGDD